ncbi:MAG: cation:proton antiporter [Terricaulis sp.]
MNTQTHSIETVLAALLVQLVVIVLSARIAGSIAVSLRQPRAVGEIVAGLMLGPSFLAAIAPGLSGSLFTPETGASLHLLSQIGLILLMFQIGTDFEFGLLSETRNTKAVVYVAIASVAAPLASGFMLGWTTAPILAPGIDPLVFSLFVAVSMAITAVPILGRILRELQLTRDEVGVIAISAAAANDILGWLLLAAISAFASASLSPASTALQIAGLIALLALLWAFGRPLVRWLLRRYSPIANTVPTNLMAIVIAMVFLCGVATQALGVFTIFGGFLVGLLFHRHPAFVTAWRHQVGQFVLTFFLPIFFTYTGLRTNIWGLDTSAEWGWCGAYFVVAVVSKVAPAYLAARAAGIGERPSAMIGVLMNTRALMELVVLNVGLSLGFIPQSVFTMLVIMAVGTTIMTGPLMHALLARAGLKRDQLFEG